MLRFFMAVDVHPVVFLQAFGQQVFERVQQIIAQRLNDTMVFFEKLILAIAGRFSNDEIAISKNDFANPVGTYVHTQVFNAGNGSAGIVTFPSFMDDLIVIDVHSGG